MKLILLILAILSVASATLQSSEAPRVRRLSVVSSYSTEIVFKYAYPVFPENQPVKDGAVDCFISRLKSTGLFTEVQVALRPTEDRQSVDIDITPTWDKRRQHFVIGRIDFDGFESFDLVKVRKALKERGLEPGISLWKFTLWEIGNMVDEAASEIYASDDLMMQRIADLNMPHPRFYLQVLDQSTLRLTVSLHRQNPCASQ